MTQETQTTDKRSVIWHREPRTENEERFAERLKSAGRLEVRTVSDLERSGPHTIKVTPAEHGFSLTITPSGKNSLPIAIHLPLVTFKQAGLDETYNFYQEQKTKIPSDHDPHLNPMDIMQGFCQRCEAPIQKALEEHHVYDKGATAQAIAGLAYAQYEQSLSHAKLGTRTGRNR